METPAGRLNPPEAVREIAERLERAGFETWCVGGAVRDALLGRDHLDWDLATAAPPDQVRALFRRTIPVGIEFGTVGVLDRGGTMHEVTTFRRDVRTDGRHAVVEFGASLDEDLARRDFTINAIAFSPRLGVLHDPFDGQGDLRRRLIRAVGVADDRMNEDRLRALRALRFAGRFSLEIEAATWRAICDSAPYLGRLSRERVKQELEKTLEQVQLPSRSLGLWRSSGALDALIPALAARDALTLGTADCVALPERTGRGERASLRRLVRLATLFVGLDGSVVRGVLRELRFSNRATDAVAHMATSWRALEAPMRTAMQDGKPSDSDLRRWASRVGRTMLEPFLRLAAARWSAERASGLRAPTASSVATAYRAARRVAWRDPVALADLAVDGRDLLDAGVAPGPALGATLSELLEWVLHDPACNTRERLLARVRELRSPQQSGA